MRVIALNSSKKIISIKNVLDDYVLQPNEFKSETGEIGQIQQSDGTFKDDPTPIINIQSVTDNTLKILRTISTTQPQDVTIADKTTYWDIIVTRNITSQLVDNVTYYTYEYIETTLPKGTDTADQVKSVLMSKKDALFSDAEYPAFNTYDANTSSTDLLKLVFSLIDSNKSLTSRVTVLEGK